MLLILRSKTKTLAKMKTFNHKMSTHLKKFGTPFEFASYENLEIYLDNGKIDITIDGKSLSKWTTIYSRKVSPYYKLAHILASFCKQNKIKFIDGFLQEGKYPDESKISQMYHFAVSKIPIPKTYCCAIYTKKQIKNALDFLKLPIVIKKCNTSYGEGVSLAKTKIELKTILDNIPKKDKDGGVFLQEFIPNDFEYRIFIVGNKIGSSEKKTRTNKNEFRNNVYLGAQEEFVKISTVSAVVKKTAIKATRIANIQVAGVDIIETAKRIAVFEVNSCPSFTYDEKISPELKSLALYLSKCEKK